MDVAFSIARIIFGGYWLMAALNQFKNLNHMSGCAKAKGTPLPNSAVAGTGVILSAGGLSMLLGVYPVIGIAMLIVFVLGVSVQNIINFTKNMALIGALLMFLLLPRPWPMSLGIG